MLRRLLLLTSLLAMPAHASLEQEVESLIEQIEQSPCAFIRNGKRYDQQQAAEHIRNKWDYAREDVADMQIFIDEVASKSWFSGKPYMVECGDSTITSNAWLTELWQQSKAQQ